MGAGLCGGDRGGIGAVQQSEQPDGDRPGYGACGNGRPGRNSSEATGSENGTGQQGEVKYSNSIPDSSDTAYIPKGEKPKSSTASIAALAKRNAVLNKRLADAKKCISCIGFVFFADKNIMTK